MVAHAIFCASRRNGVRGICFNQFFAGLLGELRDECKLMTMSIADSRDTIVASDLLDGFTALTNLAKATIPFLAPPNAVWPDCILRADGCNFGHLVRVADEERCDTYVEDVNRPGTPLFICECKYWDTSVGSDTMRSIIGGLEKLWGEKWAIVVLFCVELANWKTWEHDGIGCVKVTCESCSAKWIHLPPEGMRRKLVVVVEMRTM
ncbi:hypothetical protein V7S43_007878 [Phytophthora oleae]|uniref:Restriction endonuclease type IV Mrr domain-containing protein n=1 Tax=Phytophthora oleae TaxID=2107226 RepID=A0ABD3FKU3_9STRA